MFRRALPVLILLILLIVPLSAQDGPSGDLVVALPNDPTSLYGPNGADITAGNGASPLYNGLVRQTPNNEIVPELAESWEISDDGLEYTLHLREGVTFHNGEVFDADSVIATWQYGSDPANQYSQEYAVVTDIEVIDDYTVKLSTETPNPILLTTLAGWWAVPPAYMAEVGVEGFESAPVGTGPFVFVERVSGDRIVYEANPDYWEEGLPKVQNLTFRIIPDSTTRLAAIQTGEVDIVNRLSADEAALLETLSDVQVVSYTNDRVYYVAFKNIGNGVGTPLEDVRVRQALNYAVNRQGMIDGIFGGSAALITGFVVPGNLGYDESLEPYAYDPDRAKELLTEAGYPDGFEISMGCPTDAYLSINEVCLAIQRDLSAVGIDLSVEFKTSNSFWSQEGYGAVGPMFVDSWSASIGEAVNRLQGALIPGNYYAAWEDDTIINLINEIASTVDRDARAALYVEIQQEMYNNPPFIYLYQPYNYEAIRSDIEGYEVMTNEGYDLRAVSKAG